MTPDDLLELIRSQSFVPFRLHMANGRTVDVRHPEMIAVAKDSSAYLVAGNPNRILSLVTINELELMSPAS